MFQPLALAIGLRYLRAKRRNGFISFISMASILGIIIGVMALITTISVMTGFQEELRNRILGTISHATISGFDGPMQDWQKAVKIAEADKRVLGAAPYVEREAWLQAMEDQGAMIRGVLPEQEPRVSDLDKKMKQGNLSDLKPGEFNIILGTELAQFLGVGVGDKVTMLIAERNATPVGILPKMRRFNVVGIFEAGAQEYDFGLALVHMQDMQRMGRMGDNVTGVRLRLNDLWNAWEVARDLTDQMKGDYRVRDWSGDHVNFAFNLVSSLVMLVQDKQSDIAILRTLGLSPASVMQVFMIQGMVIGLLGISIGVVGGILLSLNLSHIVKFVESITGSELMPSDVYYISGVPSHIVASDVVTISIVAFFMCLIATLYPAWRASRTDPASALRYE
jgi:lipoprotein-releasing system permease protein